MVTWQLTGNAGHPGNSIGAYVIAFEDFSGLGDRDYNDLVVEVRGVADAPVPEPASLFLLWSGLGGLGGGLWWRSRRGR